MQAFYILLTIAAVSLGSAASATLSASATSDPQEAEYVAASSPGSQTDTGRYIYICICSQSCIMRLCLCNKTARTWYLNEKQNEKSRQWNKFVVKVFYLPKRKLEIEMNFNSVTSESDVCKSWRLLRNCFRGIYYGKCWEKTPSGHMLDWNLLSH